VVIKPRLGFTRLWEREVPDGLKKVGNGVERAMREAMDKHLQAVSAAVARFTR